MKTLYLDCFAGISGDMFVGAMIDLGLDPQVLQNDLQKIPLEGYRIQIDPVSKQGIRATSFRVFLEDSERLELADAEFLESESLAASQPEQSHFHSHGRGLNEILELINNSALSEYVKTTASTIFVKLGEAEARVHGVDVQHVHFHEVGGVDAIVDIVSAAIGLERLGIESVIASPLHLGGGFIKSSHGVLPVPAPATVEMLAGVPVYTSSMSGELVTPTGAAIITSLSRAYGPLPAMTVLGVGYGAGTRERNFPNVLRAFLGETSDEDRVTRRIEPRVPHPSQHDSAAGAEGFHNNPAVMLETTIDDCNPQIYDYLMERLLAARALDVSWIPIQMKKNRPGIQLQVLALPEDAGRFMRIIFQETTTIGIRSYPVTKHMLQREIVEVMTDLGPVHVKVSMLGDEIVTVSPEYEDCRFLAQISGQPLKDIANQALTAFSIKKET